MSRNSFKFLSLALAVSLTAAPVSAIDWNSNSTRWGLGLAVVGVCWIAYNLYFGNTPKEMPVVTQQDKNRAYNILTSVHFINKYDEKFVAQITDRIGNAFLTKEVQELSEIRKELMKAKSNNSYNSPLPNKKDKKLYKKGLKNITYLQELFDSKLLQIGKRLDVL